jgi:hypothetical protein
MDRVMELTQPLPRKGRDRSAQITGVVLPVDGGTTAGPPASQLKRLLGGG